MKGRWFLAFLLTAFAGSALHFAYDLCPSPLVGLFCPVSESVWEHLKLLYAPFLVCGFVLNRKADGAPLCVAAGTFFWTSGGFYGIL